MKTSLKQFLIWYVLLTVGILILSWWISPNRCKADETVYVMTQAEVFEAVRIVRPDIASSTELDLIAQKRADDMVRFSHDVFRAGFMLEGTGYSYSGENLAIGYDSASSTVNAWVASPLHNMILVAPRYSAVGIGVRWVDPASPIVDEQGNLIAGWLVVAEFGGISK
jgi:hypothetical protein